MANYYASARSNYFRVKDIEAFKNEVKDLGVETIDKDDLVGLYSVSENGFPNYCYDENTDEYLDVDWNVIFTKHLADDEVAIVIEAGSEKLRYINGFAIAYNNKGETKEVSLSDIYDLAKDLGKNITRAEY